jgi:N-acetylneuraminic acid mutarotase
MQSMKFIGRILFLMLGVVISAQAVPPVLNYAGQVAVNGQPFEGEGLFKFALVNTDGKITYWSNDGTSINGSEPQASVKVSVSGGLYSLLLGNTAMSGMGAIDPQVFAQHSDAKLRVWFSDGVNGFQQLSPDRPFASVPYAFSAGTAQSTTIADGSINKAMLGSDVIADLNKTVTITRDMLPTSVLNDLNKTVTITRSMLPADVLADLNKSSATASPITLSMLAPEVTAKLDQNVTIGASSIAKSMLAQEVLNDLNASTNIINPPVVGSIISFPSGQAAPTGYSLYQRGEPKLVWEEKAPVSVARYAYDGVEVLGGKIYFTGGAIGSAAKSIAERYDLTSNTWETLNAMSINRRGIACSVLNDKLYVIGGVGLSSVEIFDPSNDNWVSGVSLPGEVQYGTSITINGKIYLVGGRNASEQNINQVLCFDPATNQWSAKANMPTARHGMKLVLFENRIWAIGGYTSTYSNRVESYDPTTNSWQTEASLTTPRDLAVGWIANGKIYVGGGLDGSNHLNSIEVYDPTTKQWSSGGNLPENKFAADAVVLNDKVYVISGNNGSAYSNKVFAADLNAS